MSLRIRHNTLINLIGALIPAIVLLFTVPLYLHQIGDARYGALTIVWLLLGYFGLFDLGLSRATANQIAKFNGAPAKDREEIFWTALLMNSILGVTGGLLMYSIGGFLLNHIITISVSLHTEISSTLPWIAAAVPIATISGVLSGAIEAKQKFSYLNVIQVFGAVIFQLTPLIVSYIHGPNLDWLIPSAVFARVLSVLPLAVVAAKVLPLQGSGRPSARRVGALIHYGVWITLINIIGPILETVDRLMVGTLVGASAVAYYTVPINLANKVRLVPESLSRTLFPIFSDQSNGSSQHLFRQSASTIGKIITPIIVSSILAIHLFLTIWLGKSFAFNATFVGETVLLGVWINAPAYMAFTHLEANGRPDMIAKLHFAELLPLIPLLWLAIHFYGLLGAASIWTLRIYLDAALLFWATGIATFVVRSLWPGASLVLLSWIVAKFLPLPSVSGAIIGFSLVLLSLLWAYKSDAYIRSASSKLFGCAPTS